MDGQFNLPPKTSRAVGAGTAQAVAITLAAPGAGKRHVIDWITVTSDASGTVTASVTVVLGGATTAWEGSFGPTSTYRGPMHFVFTHGIDCGDNTAAVITLGAMTGQVGTICVGYR